MKKVIVTGGLGFIGSNLIDLLIELLNKTDKTLLLIKILRGFLDFLRLLMEFL